jgi:hypothetical protein
MLSDGLTGEELRDELSSVSSALERLTGRLDRLDAQGPTQAVGDEDAAAF